MAVAVAVAVAEGIAPPTDEEYEDAPRVCLALVGGREQDEVEEGCAGRGGEEAADDIEDADEAEDMPPEAEEARLA